MMTLSKTQGSKQGQLELDDGDAEGLAEADADGEDEVDAEGLDPGFEMAVVNHAVPVE
jgi:hypothetical protein